MPHLISYLLRITAILGFVLMLVHGGSMIAESDSDRSYGIAILASSWVSCLILLGMAELITLASEGVDWLKAISKKQSPSSKQK